VQKAGQVQAAVREFKPRKSGHVDGEDTNVSGNDVNGEAYDPAVQGANGRIDDSKEAKIKELKALMDSIKDKVSPEYQELLEEYYKALSK
jgi:hypothetical protein